MTNPTPGRRPSTSDATVGLTALLLLLAMALYGVPLAILAWRAAL